MEQEYAITRKALEDSSKIIELYKTLTDVMPRKVEELANKLERLSRIAEQSNLAFGTDFQKLIALLTANAEKERSVLNKIDLELGK